jgi:hypothetical protein
MNFLPTSTKIDQIITIFGGSTPEDSSTAVNPLIVGGVVRAAVPPTTFVAGDAARNTLTTAGMMGVTPYSVPEATWSYAAAASGILNTTTAVAVKAAAGAGLRNYITGVTLMSEALTTATEFAIRDGAAGSVLWRTKIPTGGLITTQFYFAVPLRGSANTLLEVVTLTASGAGAVYANLQGFMAP